MRLAGTSTLSPVLGLRPCRDRRCRMLKLPNPRNLIFSSLRRASTIESKTVLTMISECFLVNSETRATSSTSSAFVMDASCLLITAPPGGRATVPAAAPLVVLALVEAVAAPAALFLAAAAGMPGHLAQVDHPGALRLHVVPELLAVLLLGGGLDRQADLLLGDVHLDDLGRDRVVEAQLVGRLLHALLGDFGHVHEPLDPLGDLDEGAEIGEADDAPGDKVPDRVGLEELLPDVRLQLLDPE